MSICEKGDLIGRQLFQRKNSMLQSLLTVIALPVYALWAQGQRNGDECRFLALWAVREPTSHWGLYLVFVSWA